MDEGRYLAANTVGDVWICYPWEATYVPFPSPFLLHFYYYYHYALYLTELTIGFNSDIDEHDRLAASQPVIDR